MNKRNASTKVDQNSSKLFFNKKSRTCPLCEEVKNLDYKNPTLLEGFISECGRMLPSRITGVCSTHQRSLKNAIKNSRHLALLPFVFSHKS